MLNHLLYEIIMYYNYFSKGHKWRDNFCPPLSSPIVDFNIAAYGEKSQTEQSVPIDTMLNAHIIIMTQFSIK